jgi:hypothetical protein
VSHKAASSVVPAVVELPPAICGSPVFFGSPSTPAECFDAPQSQDPALSDMINSLIDQSLLERDLSLRPPSMVSEFSESTSSSDSSLDVGLDTPTDENGRGDFDVGDCASGSEFLSHAELEALFSEPVTTSQPMLKLCEPIAGYQRPEGLVSIAELEALFNGTFSTDVSLNADIGTWDMAQIAYLQPMFTDTFGSPAVLF